jgi:hypothetical protein
LKAISTDVKERISAMGYLFVEEGIADPSITATNSNLLKAKGSVWHKSSMEKEVVPCPGIDIDARCGYSRTKGWVFGYKLHLTSTTAGDLVVPLTADVTTANVPDNKMYVTLISSPLVFSLPTLRYMVADPGYDDKELYEYSKSIGNRPCLSSVEKYKSNFKNRLELVCFYESVLGQTAYNRRGISIESLIEHIKSVFRIDQLPVRGFHTVSASVLVSVLLYQIMIYYNCKIEKSNPKSIKYMIGTW